MPSWSETLSYSDNAWGLVTVLADSLTTTGGTATTTDDHGYDDSNQPITYNSTDYAFDANGI